MMKNFIVQVILRKVFQIPGIKNPVFLDIVGKMKPVRYRFGGMKHSVFHNLIPVTDVPGEEIDFGSPEAVSCIKHIMHLIFMAFFGKQNLQFAAISRMIMNTKV